MFGISIPSLYDHIYAYKNYEGEVKQIKSNLQSMGVPFNSVLELATGTGCYLEHFVCEHKLLCAGGTLIFVFNKHRLLCL